MEAAALTVALRWLLGTSVIRASIVTDSQSVKSKIDIYECSTKSIRLFLVKQIMQSWFLWWGSVGDSSAQA